MKLYRYLQFLDYSRINQKVTKVAVSEDYIYLGTQDGYLILVELPSGFDPDQLIDGGKFVKMVQIFDPLTGRHIPLSSWHVESNSQDIIRNLSAKETSTYGSIIDIVLGPSSGLKKNEALCLSKAGCLILLNSDLVSPPHFCMMNVKAFGQKMYWDTHLENQKSEGSLVLNSETSLLYNKPVLTVVKDNHLIIMCRTESSSPSPFVSIKKALLNEVPLRLLWVEDIVCLVFQNTYQLYSVEPILCPLQTNIFSEIIPKESQQRYSKLSLTQTDIHEFMVMGNNHLGIFIDFLTLKLVNKSTIAWQSSVTLALSTGPFIIGSTVDEELMIFTSRMPIMLCQTLPTHGEVVDMASFTHIHSKKTSFGGYSEANPVLVSTTRGLWVLIPIPFISQMQNLIREFNPTEALRLFDIYIPSQQIQRHRELCYFYEALSWRYLQEQLVHMALTHFYFADQCANSIARLLVLWSDSFGLFPRNSLSNHEKFPTDSWRHVLYHWLVARGLLENFPPCVPYQHHLESSSLFFSIIIELQNSLISRDDSHFKLPYVKFTHEDKSEYWLKWSQTGIYIAEFFVNARNALCEAYLSGDLNEGFSAYDEIQENVLYEHTQAMRNIWNHQFFIRRSNFFFVKSMSSEAKEDVTRILRFLEAGLFLRLIDVVLITLGLNLDSETDERHALMSEKIKSLLFPSDRPTMFSWNNSARFISQPYTESTQRIINHFEDMSQKLFCMTSWLSHACSGTLDGVLPSLCSIEDFSHVSFPQIQSSWIILFHLHQLQFEKALEYIFHQSSLSGKQEQHVIDPTITFYAVHAFFNALCICPYCQSGKKSSNQSFDSLKRFLPDLCDALKKSEAQLGFLLMLIVGCLPLGDSFHKLEYLESGTQFLPSSAHDASEEIVPCFDSDQQDYNTNLCKHYCVVILPITWPEIMDLVSQEVKRLYTKKQEQKQAYDVLLFYLAWSSSEKAYKKLDSVSNTQFLKECFQYYKHKEDSSLESLVISRYNLLYILEVEPYYDAQEVLDTISSLTSEESQLYTLEKSICYVRLGHLRNSIEILLDPESTNSLTLCEMFCHAINMGKYPVGSEDDQGGSPRSQLFTEFLHPRTSHMFSFKLEAELDNVYQENNEVKNTELANFYNDDILLDISPSIHNSLTKPIKSTNKHYRMLYLLAEILISKWKEYDALNKGDSGLDYLTQFYRYCILTLLHKYVKHPDLDFVDVLQILPESWPLSCLVSYITHGFRSLASMESSELIRESLTRISHLKSSAEWATVVAQSINITRESTCPICSKRLALPKTKSSGFTGLPHKIGQNVLSFLAWNIRTGECGHMHCLQQHSL